MDQGTINAIVGILGAFGGVLLLFNRLGFVSFGKKKCSSSNGCPDPNCQKDVVLIKHQVGTIAEHQPIQDAKLDTVVGEIQWVRGYLEKNGKP